MRAGSSVNSTCNMQGAQSTAGLLRSCGSVNEVGSKTVCCTSVDNLLSKEFLRLTSQSFPVESSSIYVAFRKTKGQQGRWPECCGRGRNGNCPLLFDVFPKFLNVSYMEIYSCRRNPMAPPMFCFSAPWAHTHILPGHVRIFTCLATELVSTWLQGLALPENLLGNWTHFKWLLRASLRSSWWHFYKQLWLT